MLKKIIPLHFIACTCASGATLTGGATAETASVFGDYGNTMITLNPPSLGGTGYFDGDNQTAKSVIAGGNAIVFGGFNVDYSSGDFEYAVSASGGDITLSDGTYSVSSESGDSEILFNASKGKTFTIASDGVVESTSEATLIFQGGGTYNIAGELKVNGFELRGSMATQTGRLAARDFRISDRSSIGSNAVYTVKAGAELFTDSVSMGGTSVDYTFHVGGYLKNGATIEVGAQYSERGSGNIPPAAFYIYEGGTVDTDGLKIGSRVDVAGTLNAGNIDFAASRNRAVLNVFDTGTVNINGDSLLAETRIDGSVNINAGTTNIYGEKGVVLQGGTLNVKSGAGFAVEKFAAQDDTYALSVAEGGYHESRIYVESGGKIDLTQASNGNDLSIGVWGSGASLSVKADAEHAVYLNKICVRDSIGTLTIDSKNVFRSKNAATGEEGYDILFVVGGSSMLRLNVNAEAHFGDLEFQNSNARLTVNMGRASDTYLSFNDIVITQDGVIADVFFYDFRNGSVYFESMDEIHDNMTIAGAGIDGTKLSGDDFYLIAGEFDGKTVYWLHSDLAVPEPAEWAAILGAIVLALAALKRRRRA